MARTPAVPDAPTLSPKVAAILARRGGHGGSQKLGFIERALDKVTNGVNTGLTYAGRVTEAADLEFAAAGSARQALRNKDVLDAYNAETMAVHGVDAANLELVLSEMRW